MHSDLQKVVNELALITPPESLDEIQADAAGFFDLNVRWLGLELEYRKTSDGAFQEQANELIPELIARVNELFQDVSDQMWVLNLP